MSMSKEELNSIKAKIPLFDKYTHLFLHLLVTVGTRISEISKNVVRAMDSIFETEQLLLGENSKLLSDQSLSHLRKYKYNGVDKSILSKLVLNRFWTWCAGFMPPWLAPNVITLIGISAILLGNLFVCIFQHGGDLYTPMPRIVYIYIGFAFIFYQTMDNIDGKQARKTGTSSPLGELFDHGIDSLNCLWGALLMVSTLSQGSSFAAILSMLAPMAGMFLSTWETYFTKTLFLDYLNAPTEGLVVATSFHVLAGLFGPEIWTEKHIWGTELPLGMLWTISLAITVTLMHAPSCIRNVYKADPENFYSVALPTLWPIVLISASVLLWVSGPNSTIISSSDVPAGHLYLFGWALSFTFGRVSTTVILSHLCHSKFPKLSFPVILLALGALIYGVLPRLGLDLLQESELKFLWFYFLASGAYFFGFAHLVIDRITHYLGIRAFTIPRY